MPSQRPYAGIGSRETPPWALSLMTEVAIILARRGWTLRSGGADGADDAFEQGMLKGGGKQEIFLPWRGFNGRNYPAAALTDDHIALAAALHPAWWKNSQGAKKMHARNGSQALGVNLDDPSHLIICWTKGGQMAGGTAQALRIARSFGIPIINFGDPRLGNVTPDRAVEMAEEMAKVLDRDAFLATKAGLIERGRAVLAGNAQPAPTPTPALEPDAPEPASRPIQGQLF